MRQRVRLDDKTNGTPNERRAAKARTWRGHKAHHLRLDDEVVRRFAELTEEGMPFNTVCDSLRVSRSAARSWISMGRAFERSGGEPPEAVIYAAFKQEVRAARATFLREALRRAKSDRDWRRWISILARRDRQNWAAVLSNQVDSDAERVIPPGAERYL